MDVFPFKHEKKKNYDCAKMVHNSLWNIEFGMEFNVQWTNSVNGEGRFGTAIYLILCIVTANIVLYNISKSTQYGLC